MSLKLSWITAPARQAQAEASKVAVLAKQGKSLWRARLVEGNGYAGLAENVRV
jgi:hypothetical protein